MPTVYSLFIHRKFHVTPHSHYLQIVFVPTMILVVMEQSLQIYVPFVVHKAGVCRYNVYTNTYRAGELIARFDAVWEDMLVIGMFCDQ